jgi:quercetin dioxygenase-like cupin family protein
VDLDPESKMKPLLNMIAAVVAIAALGSPVKAAPESTASITYWDPGTMTWQINRPGGTQLSVLEGDLKTPGQVVTYAFHMPDGAWFPAHTHPASARVFVLKGVLLLGEGTSPDRAKARRVVAGQAALVPAELAHFEGAEGDTVIIGVAVGPWSTTFLPQPAGR